MDFSFQLFSNSSFAKQLENFCETISSTNRSLIDSQTNASKSLQTTTDYEDESDDGLNDLSDLLSPLNADVIERELTELACSANGAFDALTVSELVSAIDGPLLSSPLKFSPPKNCLSRNGMSEESPFSAVFHPSILKRRQTIVDYTTPPSMKKTRNPLNDNQMFSNTTHLAVTSTPFFPQTQDYRCLPFSPTQVWLTGKLFVQI